MSLRTYAPERDEDQAGMVAFEWHGTVIQYMTVEEAEDFISDLVNVTLCAVLEGGKA